ncbi:MAG: hypothetical protein ABIH83_04455 [Candidatus Micrarchaeota archaeon]
MADITIHPSELKGDLTPPPSLEVGWRLVWGACLGHGGAIENCPSHPDINAIIALANQIGADAKFSKNTADIFGAAMPQPITSLSCNNNSRASRIAIPIAFLSEQIVSIKEFNIPSSPSAWLDIASSQLGVRITKTSEEISVSGSPFTGALELKDRPGVYWAPGFMMAAPFSARTSVFSMDDFVSIHPAVKNTLEAFRIFETEYVYDKSEGTLTIPSGQTYPERYVDVPADWRTGSYFLGALALAGKGNIFLSSFSNQPEKEFWEIFRANKMLASSEDGLSMKINSSRPLPLPPVMDLRPYPSLLPLMILLATQSHRSTKIGPLYPISSFTRKRAHNTINELNKLGANIKIKNSYIHIPYAKLKGGTVDSCNDSRVCMALALAGLISSSPVKIENAEAVDKSHSNFWNDLKKLGAKIRISK